MSLPASLVFPLHCTLQKYAWGKKGSKSEVARLTKAVCNGFEIDEETPYAELWMGTHPSSQSRVLHLGVDPTKGVPLGDWLLAFPDSLGPKVVQKFDGKLPFLFKVLSVNNALSIQAHPDKKLAEELHRTKPDMYKDPNHKPELAIALTPFKAMCGFRPYKEICSFINDIPELQAVVGKDAFSKMTEAKTVTEEKDALKTAFRSLMTCPEDTVKQNLTGLIETIKSASSHDRARLLGDAIIPIHKDFPGDVGCFCVYFLNVLTLKPGQAIFLGPNEPHAYLEGDCIECMANSDNTVRAGLTPKFKDVETLCEMLTYKCEEAAKKIFKGTIMDAHTVEYAPPVPDFAVSKFEVPRGTESFYFPLMECASIVIVVNGIADAHSETVGNETFDFKRGVVFFLSANETLSLYTVESDMLIFRAYCKV